MADEERKESPLAQASGGGGPSGPAGNSQAGVGPGAMDISRRTAAGCLCAIMLVCGLLLAKQIVCFRIASADACVYYIPLAQKVEEGKWNQTRLPSIPPLYPMLAGLTARFFVSSDMPSIAGAQAVNSVSLLLTVLLIYLLGTSAFNRRVGLAAAGLAGLNPWMIKFAASVGPETLYGLLLTALAMILALYRRRPDLPGAVMTGVMAGLAMLTRSEGIVMVPVAGAVVLYFSLAKMKRQKSLVVRNFLIMFLAAGAVSLPRLAYIYEQTGYCVPDVRLAPYLGGRNVDLMQWPSPLLADAISPDDVARLDPAGWKSAAQAGPSASPDDYPGLRIRWADVWESLVMVIGPAAWLFAIVWFSLRAGLPRRGGEQTVIGLVLLAQLGLVVLAIVLPFGLNKLDRRYVVPIAALAQLWGALGMVGLAERLRNLSGLPGRLGRSIPIQLAAMWLLLAGLACWSVFMENAGVRHADLAELGRHARSMETTFEPVVLASSPETACYAGGRLVSLREVNNGAVDVSPRALAAICRSSRADYLVVRSDDVWCEWLALILKMGFVPPRAVDAVTVCPPAGRRPDKSQSPGKSYLLDAHIMADFLDLMSP
ncbi:MAG: glycosyltransferase family 39 protein [Planctomycetes bacterium]|nr:glycosyltransferase family 39 protein [Planctomycetota bacterium]